MININLHDYRKELKKIQTQKRFVKAISTVGVLLFFILANWAVLKINLNKIRGETQKLEKAVKKLAPQVKAIQKVQSFKKRKVQIIGEIDNLRGKQFPVSKIISDLNIAVPSGVWLDSVSQMTTKSLEDKKIPVILFRTLTSKKKKGRKKGKPIYEFIEIKGKALGEQLIAEYVKNLQEIPYYKMTFLQKSTQTIMDGHTIYSFTAYSYMPEDRKEPNKIL